MYGALSLSVVIIFMIQLFHFRRIRTPFLLFISLTLCLFGTAIGIKIMDLDFSITCVLGVVSLMGILVRNGIIMYDYAEELRK